MTDEEARAIAKENITEALAGRPTKYREEYCQMLIDFMGDGFSYEAFAGLIGVHVDTLYEWEKAVYPESHAQAGQIKYPSFSEAKKRAFSANRVYWERAGKTGMFLGVKDFNATVWIFNMKNRFKWRDNVDVTSDGEKVESLNGLLGLLKPTKTGPTSGTADGASESDHVQ